MDLLIIFLFWSSLIYISYAEIGYLAILWFISRFRIIQRQSGDITPSVTVFIAAYNEEKVIREKIINTLNLDYPREKVQILVASDCSSDRTDEIVQEYSSAGVQLVRSCPRQGKIVALRTAESQITGELVLFTDADSQLSPNTLQALVRRFIDPKVGAISGRETRQPLRSSSKGKGEGIYNRIDTKIKTLEGLIGNQVGVHGGIFIVRRTLLPYVPDHLSHDAIVPLQHSLMGYKTLYEPEAVSYETYDLDTAQDWRRRIRTVLQSIQSYLYVKEALNPFKTGLYAIQIFSHRFSRWFVLPAMLIALLSNLFLVMHSPLYQLLMIGQAGCYGLALIGLVLDRTGHHPLIFYLPYYFVYIHIPAFWAILLHLSGKKMTTWRPVQHEVISSQ